jgi:hypothetical protein
MTVSLSSAIHDPHLDVVAAAVAGTSATVLTLLAMLGGSGNDTFFLKLLFQAQLWVIESALIVGLAALLVRSSESKRRCSHFATLLLVAGTILIATNAALFSLP